jgi:hypothetical protein
MKTTKIIALLGLMLLPAFANAQWEQDTTFKPVGDDEWLQIHGVAVDGEGKIWVQPYSTTDKIVVQRDLGNDGIPDTLSTRVVYVYNSDGTPASFSPLKVIKYSGDIPADTLGRVWIEDHYEGYSGRGITADMNGDIIITAWNRLYKVDHTTGMGMVKVDVGIGSLTEATVDADNNIYITAVTGADAPIIKYDSNLKNPETLLTMTGSYSRDFQVSPDGMTIWWAGYTGPGVLRYSRPDEYSGFNTVPDTVLRGLDVEAFDIQPKTQYLWVGSGGANANVPDAPWTPQTLYAFDYATLSPNETPIPLDSIHWVPAEDVYSGFDSALPRGIDFSADGTVAYFAAYDAVETDIDLQKFTTDRVFVSNEPDRKSEIPSGYALEQNYPNPFNPTTNINYTINEAGPVTLKVYDMTGREVATLVNSRMSAGSHQVSFDASNLASGVYLYMLQANGVRLTNRMTLIK